MNGGAVAYLTHSQYGRNRNEVTINNSSSYITGNAGSSVTASSASGITNAYNTTAGMLASTTGNIYGVYDMSGGAWDRTAVWDTKSSSISSGTAYFANGGTSDKYKTAYSNGTNTSSGSTVATVCRTGDGIKETWVSSNRSWFSDYSVFVNSRCPSSERGGNCYCGVEDGAGVFGSNGYFGYADSSESFRAVLAG